MWLCDGFAANLNVIICNLISGFIQYIYRLDSSMICFLYNYSDAKLV